LTHSIILVHTTTITKAAIKANGRAIATIEKVKEITKNKSTSSSSTNLRIEEITRHPKIKE